MANTWEAVPVLAALNMDEMIEFYTDKMGFVCDSQHEQQYGIVSRGDAEIHFWNCDERHVAENTSCYVYVKDIKAVHDELKDKVKVSEIKSTNWGVLEMYVFDPSGNLLKFGQLQ
jgi:catechol 2,3-dioxygenase-like lactoylglutathione lyase family enzyme